MNKKHSLPFIGFLQATALTLYCSLVAYFMFSFEDWFRYIPDVFVVALLILIFSVSALICAYITLGQSVKIYLEQNNINRSIRLVGFTSLWGLFYIFTIILGLIYLK